MALENWNIDVVHSTVGFTVRHLMVSKVHGFFTKWNGKLAFDEQNPSASHAEAQIEVAPGVAMNAENLFDARLAIVRDADLETGRTRVVHDLFYSSLAAREESR